MDKHNKYEIIQALLSYKHPQSLPIEEIPQKRKEIIKKYNEYNFIINKKKGTYTYIDGVDIYVDKEDWYDNSSYESLFTLLHEVGHLKTNKVEMSKAEREYRATQWAIEESKLLNIYEVSVFRRLDYEKDIKNKLQPNETEEMYELNW